MTSIFTFQKSADPDSLTLLRNGTQIGFLQKHSVREPRIVLFNEFSSLTRRELELCLEKFEQFVGK